MWGSLYVHVSSTEFLMVLTRNLQTLSDSDPGKAARMLVTSQLNASYQCHLVIS